MKKPFLQDDALLADVQAALRDSSSLHIWWLGQSGFLVQWQGRHLLFDPYLSDSLTEKYAASNKPHVRMTERVVAPEKLNFIELVTSSHNHTDHLDGETLKPLIKANPELKLIVPKANLGFAAERLQVSVDRLTGVTVGQTLELDDFNFYAVPAAHEELEQDDKGHHKFIGLLLQVGSWTLYHSGDTVRYEGMAELLKQWQIDIAFLPINGRDLARAVAGNLSSKEAVQLAQDVGISWLVPCHFDMFAFNTVSPDAFVAAAEQAGQPYKLLQNGERFSLEAP